MKWLRVPDDPRQLMSMARIQDNLDFRAGFKTYLEELRTELSLGSAELKEDIAYRQNQGRLQTVIDLLTLCKNAHEWAVAKQKKTK